MAAVTLLEAAKSMPDFPRALVETYALSYHPLQQLVFAPVVGGVLKWNLEDYITNGGNRTVGSDFTPGVSNKAPVAAAAGIYGGKLQIDHFTSSMAPSEIVFQRQMRIKSMAKTFCQHFFEGSGESGQFAGIRTWISQTKWSGQQINHSTASAGALITLDSLDEACDGVNVEQGKTFMYMSRVVRRAITKLARASNIGGGSQTITYGVDEFGKQVMMFNGIPMIALHDGNGGEILSQVETYAATTGGTAGSIYIVTYGAESDPAVHGAYLPHAKADGGQFFIQEAVDGSNYDTDRMEWFPFPVFRIPRCFMRIAGVKQAVS